MKHLLLAPHNDDEALFASFIVLRLKPQIIVVTDGVRQEAKYGKEWGVFVRRQESEEAAKILGTEVDFLGIPDNGLFLDNLIINLEDMDVEGMVFAPAIEGGNAEHDIVSQAATKLWGGRVLYYSTYSKESFVPQGELALMPTTVEKMKKEQALRCYKTQLGINQPIFRGVKDRPEYLNFNP